MGAQSEAQDGVGSEKSTVLSCAVPKWDVQSDRMGDVSIRLVDRFLARQSTSSPDWRVASSAATVHGTPHVPFKDRSDSQAALR